MSGSSSSSFILSQAEDIAAANSVNMAELRDPATDASRVKNPEWLVVLGICTHLGCVPMANAGDYGGIHILTLLATV